LLVGHYLTKLNKKPMEKFIIDANLMNDIKLVILNSKQEFFPTQKMITILNQLQNLEKIEKE